MTDVERSSNKWRDSLDLALGAEIHDWIRDLFPIRRSLTGNGNRATLAYLQRLMPQLTIHEIPSGSAVFDWVIPDEWNASEAYIETETGERIVDVADNNLHILGYSEPVDLWLDRDELDAHLHSLPDQPDLIPYVTSYYKRRWGFCLSDRQRRSLPDGRYHVVIRSTLAPGSLSYGELILPGQIADEVLLSTYICHPSMANNELSGPTVTAAIARHLASLPKRRLTYRIVLVPETIGAIAYLSRNIEMMKHNTVTCVGDDRAHSMLCTPSGDTLADRVARHALKYGPGTFEVYDFLERGSDERQYCSPGVNLPVASVMRSKYGNYPEYHTSADDLSCVSPAGLAGGYQVLKDCLSILESDGFYRTTTPCEPQLGKRGLYPTISTRESGLLARDLTNILAFADGRRDLVALGDRIGRSALDILPAIDKLMQHGLIERLDQR